MNEKIRELMEQVLKEEDTPALLDLVRRLKVALQERQTLMNGIEHSLRGAPIPESTKRKARTKKKKR